MPTVAFNELVSGTIAAGEQQTFDIMIPRAGKFVVECGGTANILWGIWQTDFTPTNGKLRICGVARRGVRMLVPVNHVIRVTGNTAGDFTFKIRGWSFTDYFTINFYRSTC